MIKSNLIFFVLLNIFIGSIVAQEIPNNDFEEWETTNTWTDTPVGWSTQNGQVVQNTVRDSMPQSGDWAMRVYPTFDGGTGEYGYATTSFALDGFVPPTLEFYAKWEKESTCAVSVEVNFLNAGTVVFADYWFASSDTSEWVEVVIPISQVGIEVTEAQIIVSAFVGDLAPGSGWIAVDNMQFGVLDGIDEFISTDLFIGPNPCNSVIYINAERYQMGSQVIVYDQIGHIVHIGKLERSIDTSSYAEGIYTLQVREGDLIVQERFQVLH